MQRKSGYERAFEASEHCTVHAKACVEIVRWCAEANGRDAFGVMRDVERALFDVLCGVMDEDRIVEYKKAFPAKAPELHEIIRRLSLHARETGRECLSDLHQIFAADLGRGQVFMPWEAADFLANSVVSKEIARDAGGDRPVEVIEPACGCGRLVVSAARALRRTGRKFRIVAADVDADAVKATVVNCFLLSIPACVVHGNFLSGEVADAVVCEPPKPPRPALPEELEAVKKILKSEKVTR